MQKQEKIDAEAHNKEEEYWNRFYEKSTIAPWPSQFATFVLGEIGSGGCIIDLGCGSGRDSFFFSANDMKVVGVDASEEAIRSCTRIAGESNESITFICSSIDSPDLSEKLSKVVNEPKKLSFYARFFIHAITPEQEDDFFRLVADLARAGDHLALEFRTLRDAMQPKVTPDHYRRYITPMSIIEKAHRHGFENVYYVEGFGFAKFRSDDAYVARCIFKKS